MNESVAQMSWLATARRLLRNWTRSQAATLIETELSDLHIALREGQRDHLLGLHNIGVIRNFILDPKREVPAQLALAAIVYPSCAPVEYHTRRSSSLLLGFVFDLSKHATTCLHEKRGEIRIKHDTYSPGALCDMYMRIPNRNNSTSQYIAIVKRTRIRPESLPTTAELYCLLSLAARINEETHAEVIKVRLFIVYSSWVQILSATAPLSYILSMLQRKGHIEGHMEISESPWFNLLSLSGLERILLYAFESTTLVDHKRVPEMFLKLRHFPQSRVPKRKADGLGGGDAKRHKIRGAE